MLSDTRVCVRVCVCMCVCVCVCVWASWDHDFTPLSFLLVLSFVLLCVWLRYYLCSSPERDQWCHRPALSTNRRPVAMDTPGWAAATAFHIIREGGRADICFYVWWMCMCRGTCDHVHTHTHCQRYRSRLNKRRSRTTLCIYWIWYCVCERSFLGTPVHFKNNWLGWK